MSKPISTHTRTSGGLALGSLHFSARDVVVTVGFACLIVTMLIYSAAAMPFQRFETLPDFVTMLGRALRTAAPLGALAALVCMLGWGRVFSLTPVRAVFGAAFVVGNATFCAMALGGAWPAWAINVFGVCIGVGCLGQALAWGRVLARYRLRQATGVVAASAVLAALLGWAQLQVSEAFAVVIFLACTLACVALPFVFASRDAKAGSLDADDERGAHGSPDAASGERGAAVAREPLSAQVAVARVRAFLDMAAVPALGLMLFAMLMAVRGELFFEDYLQYVWVQVAVAALLFAFMLLASRLPLLRAVYRGLIPALGVVVLCVNYLSEAIWGGTPAEITLVFVLYTAAALLTLSTLAGMAHAAEFSSDLVVSLAVALFSFITVLTQTTLTGMGDDEDMVRVFIVTTSGVYAAVMILHALWRGLRGEGDRFFDAGGAGAEASSLSGASAPDGAGGVGAASIEGAVFASNLDERCDALAARFSLTAREREILGYLARGHAGPYISDELLISSNTVRTHIHNIYRKLGVSTREDILRLVRE